MPSVTQPWHCSHRAHKGCRRAGRGNVHLKLAASEGRKRDFHFCIRGEGNVFYLRKFSIEERDFVSFFLLSSWEGFGLPGEMI